MDSAVTSPYTQALKALYWELAESEAKTDQIRKAIASLKPLHKSVMTDSTKAVNVQIREGEFKLSNVRRQPRGYWTELGTPCQSPTYGT